MSGTVALGETTGTALLDFQGSTISVGHIGEPQRSQRSHWVCKIFQNHSNMWLW